MRLLSVITLAAATSLGHATSFDCDKAASVVETSVCKEPRLSALDDELNQEFQAALKQSSAKSALVWGQKVWLTKVRNRCRDSTCLADAYIAE